MKRGRITYGDDKKLEVQKLADAGKNPYQISQELRISYQTVRNWLGIGTQAPRMSRDRQLEGAQVVDYKRLFNVLVDRLSALETDATKRSVLMLLKKRPEHMSLLEDLYSDEPPPDDQAPAVQREVEERQDGAPSMPIRRRTHTT